MGTHITQSQLEEVERMAQRGAEPVDVYKKLAQYGDSYADGAVAVFKPASNGWYTVRSIWHETNANMSKFDTVARTHMNQYVNLIRQGYDGQNGYKLPNSAQIEESYVQALEKSGLTARTAIDVNISKIKITTYDSPIENSFARRMPNWYETPLIMNLEDERIRPSYPYIMNKVGGDDALNTYKNVFGDVKSQLYEESLRRVHSKTPSLLNSDASTIPEHGVYFYENNKTHNWAVFDKNWNGMLYLDGHKEKIDYSNFRYKQDGHAEFLKDGQWRGVELKPAYQLSPDVKYERALMAGLVEPTDQNQSVQIAKNNQTQTPLTQPIAVNASSQEVTSYLFAALMSDDDDLRYAAIDSALQTNVAQESALQAQQAVIAYDNQQALIEQQNQQINNPVRVMRM
jgi:hypothetical protein